VRDILIEDFAGRSPRHFPMLWEQRLNVMQELADWLAKYNKE